MCRSILQGKFAIYLNVRNVLSMLEIGGMVQAAISATDAATTTGKRHWTV
jgi:hypothetical protein